ncbi:MAG: 2-hydroxy-3-keto-5-methylthiopentenyl-1-phosphate phosphatase [Thermoleophilia bacterium]
MTLPNSTYPPDSSDSGSVTFFIVCDFDGTITVRDTLNLVVKRYAPQVWDSMEEKLQSGELSLVEVMKEEFRHVKAPEDEVVDFVLREAGLRRGFTEFVDWVEEEGHELVVVSAGFRVLIDAVLLQAGLHRLHVHAGDALFSTQGAKLSFPPASAECLERCGHCKSETIESHAPFPGPVVYVGDGYSDRCPALEADVVFARGDLATYLEGKEVSFYQYEDFFEVRDVLQRLARTFGRAAGAGRS